MIELDVSLLASDVANLLMLRGADLPALQWSDKPNQAAKDMLDGIMDDSKLLKCSSLADEGMSAAVRALLYLWNGWPAECGMYAQAAPERERVYIDALCERHSGRPDEAKAVLHQLDDHRIYKPLMEYAIETIGLGTDPPLRRLKQILQLGETWEPFAFIDLIEQSRAGKHCQSTEQTVRSIQCREFELLLARCYEAATGQRLPEKASTATVVRRKPTPKLKRKPASAPKSEKKAADKTPANPPRNPSKPKTPRVGVVCPKCQKKMAFPETHRGTQQRCGDCNAVFLIPGKTAPAAST